VSFTELGVELKKWTHRSELVNIINILKMLSTCGEAHLPVSNKTFRVEPSRVILLIYWAFPVLPIGTAPRRRRELGDKELPVWTSKGMMTAFTD
jgi:hypothetical protein